MNAEQLRAYFRSLGKMDSDSVTVGDLIALIERQTVTVAAAPAAVPHQPA